MEEIKLYNGQETLFFDPVPHQYFWNDEQIPSATTITKLLTPANVIGLWSAKVCSEEFKKLIRAGVSYDEIELVKIAERSRVKYLVAMESKVSSNESRNVDIVTIKDLG